MRTVKVMPEKREITVEEGDVLYRVGADNGFCPDGSCGGKGICGKCMIHIRDNRGFRDVLACEYTVTDDIEVWPERNRRTADRKSSVMLPEWFIPERASDKDASEKKNLGVAVDIGTTTVVCILWDLNEPMILGIKSFDNPQRVYGSDVISRISYVMNNPERLKKVQEETIDGINEAVAEILKNADQNVRSIRKYSVVGNTTMSHLFTGTDPGSLAVLPFKPVFTEGKLFRAVDVGLKPDDAQIILMPNIAGHVGSDITVGMLACDFLRGSEPAMYVDIGTNGEIGLICDGKLMVCSTAAGPAFEGSRISCGMRAGTGAIEKARMTETGMDIKVIGEVEPAGICGSGIIDIVYELVKKGIVNEGGRLNSGEEENGKRVYTVWRSHDNTRKISITQNDIREVQLAKGAIAAGSEILMKKAGIDAGNLKAVYIAGAFGSYIDLAKAMGIGLIPHVRADILKSVGNAAGTGACMGVLNRKFLNETEEVRKKAEHVELSTEPEFLKTYTGCMRFNRYGKEGGV